MIHRTPDFTLSRRGLQRTNPEDKTAPGNVWVAGILHTAKHEGDPALRDELVGWKATLRGPKERQAAEALIGYVTDRREMIKYPQFQAVGRQIGSGPTESMCKATTLRINDPSEG